MASRFEKITAGQLLFPLSLVAFVLFLLLAFQTTQIVRDREALHQARLQQDKPLEEANKVQAQLEALALGTKKLAEKGDKDAQAIIDRMKQIGITVGGAAPTLAPGAAPGAVNATAPAGAAAPPATDEAPQP